MRLNLNVWELACLWTRAMPIGLSAGLPSLSSPPPPISESGSWVGKSDWLSGHLVWLLSGVSLCLCCPLNACGCLFVVVQEHTPLNIWAEITGLPFMWTQLLQLLWGKKRSLTKMSPRHSMDFVNLLLIGCCIFPKWLTDWCRSNLDLSPSEILRAPCCVFPFIGWWNFRSKMFPLLRADRVKKHLSEI